MPILISAFSIPKIEACAKENQDAVWPRMHGLKKYQHVSDRIESKSTYGQYFVGVADGATEGILAGDWANIILRYLSKLNQNQFDSETILQKLNLAHTAWERLKKFRSKSGSQSITNLPEWLEEAALKRGAFTTVCAAVFCENGNMYSLAVGDSCVFHVRNDKLIESWPITQSEDFDNSPFLISSEPALNVNILDHLKTTEKNWYLEDQFYFATDAIACWISKQIENNNEPWNKLASFDAIAAPEEFVEFVQSLRARGEIRDDDTTLVKVTFTPI